MPALRNHAASSRLPEERLIRSAAVSALVYVVLATVYILVSGRIATGDRLVVLPSGRESTVSGLLVAGAPAESATVGAWPATARCSAP